jgi:hypothetical protein
MGLIDEIINDGIKETREYYEKAISNITSRYQAVYNRFKEDSAVMEQLLADHGYKIVSYNNGFQALKDDYYNPRANVYTNELAFTVNVQKDNGGIIPLNYKLSSAKANKGKLYFSLKHKSPTNKKRLPEQYWLNSACCQTPFVQLFAKSPSEVIDTFFLALDGLSNIKSEHDYNKYVSLTCKAIKENHELIRELKRL